jgi:hypothetical protein
VCRFTNRFQIKTGERRNDIAQDDAGQTLSITMATQHSHIPTFELNAEQLTSNI